MGDTATWLQLILQAGAFGLLVLIVLKAPTLMKEARDGRIEEAKLQQSERKILHEQMLGERKEEREARHSLAGQFHTSILSAMAANAQMRDEDRKAFETRNHEIVMALEKQTDILAKKLDSTHKEVQRLVVKAEHVTVIPPKSD